MTTTASYQQRMDAAIRDLILESECQPVLFVGSGMSRRYFGAPNWHELLEYSLSICDDGGYPYAYYKQRFENRLPIIGSEIAKRLHEWAWKSKSKDFPEELFNNEGGVDSFLKYIVSSHLSSITPSVEVMKSTELWPEIDLLSAIRPHAIITTNFDGFLESIFSGYEPIVGQSIIKYNMNSFGEIFKIHGSASDSSSLVLTEADYNNFIRKKKYLSAKLLTYLTEHPVFVFGYSFNDENVASIISDIGEMVANGDGFIPNIFYVKWDPSASEGKNPPEEYVIGSGDAQYRIRTILSEDFGWIYKAIASEKELKSVNTKLVRALAARAYKLIRSDIPKGVLEVDYGVLEQIADSDDQLPKLLGITQTSNANMTHPFTLTQVAQRVGFKHWNPANKLIHEIKHRTGIDIRSTDNRYHCQIKSGAKSTIRKWSQEAVELMKKVKDGEEFSLKMD